MTNDRTPAFSTAVPTWWSPGTVSSSAAIAPDVLARFDELGFEAHILKPDEFGKLVQRDIDVTRKLAAQLGVKPQ